MTDKRAKTRIKKRRNFLPAFLFSVLLWTVWLVVLFLVPPKGILIPLLFIFITFAVITVTFALIFANTRRGIFAGIGVCAYMLLNWLKLGNFINFILIAGILVALDYYLSTRH